jgi:TonB-dependent SusC/RagA subfamily outer membrane receptor
VAIVAGDEKQVVRINMLSSAFSPMYEDGTTITATNSFISNGNGLSIDEEMTGKLGGDIRMNMHSGNLEQGAAMFIRGISSINANAQPLIIVDGVELDMQQSRVPLHQGDIFNMLASISPEDIYKVTVLKNATALYGARGSNGVILIETKRGHSMATRIDAKLGVGWTFTPNYPTMMNAAQYRNYAVEQLGTIPEVQRRIGSSTNPLQFNFLNDAKDGYYYNTYHNDTDWSDYVYRTALTHNYSINVQGGDDIGMYNLSVAYIQTMKNVRSTSFDRINVRFNTDINLLYNFHTKFDMSFSRTNTNLFDEGVPADLNAGTITSPAFLSLIKSPLLNPYQYNKNINDFTSLLSDADDL